MLNLSNTKATKPSTASTQTVSKVAQVNANNSGARATVYDKTGKMQLSMLIVLSTFLKKNN